MPKTAIPQVKIIIRAYIGLLIKFPENISFKHLTLRPEYLPDDMQMNEGTVLLSIFNLRERNIVSTRDNLANWVVVQNRSDLVGVIDSIIKEVEEEDDRSGVPTYAQFIDTWMQNQTGIAASVRASTIMAEPNADYEDKYRRASTAFSEAMPKSMTAQEYTESDLIDLVVRDNAATIAENVATGEIGWGLPFAAYRAYFTRLKKREFSTWIAETGVGKTTLMMVSAEYHSWKQKIKSDTVIFQMETTPEELGQRQFARHLRIPYDAIDSGNVNLSDARWSVEVEKFRELRRTMSNDHGHIEIKYCPGWTVDQVTMAMEGYMQASLSAGRQVSFWLDNLQRVNWTIYGNMKQNEAYELIADRLSYSVRRYPNTHFNLIAQEFDDRVAGSRAIERMSQKMFSLRRESPEGGMSEDLMITKTIKEAGKDKLVPVLDALGGKRYWHRKGDKRSGKGTIEILKTNSGRTGTIEVWLEGALNRMSQDPAQLETLSRLGLLPKEKK